MFSCLLGLLGLGFWGLLRAVWVLVYWFPGYVLCVVDVPYGWILGWFRICFVDVV